MPRELITDGQDRQALPLTEGDTSVVSALLMRFRRIVRQAMNSSSGDEHALGSSPQHRVPPRTLPPLH